MSERVILVDRDGVVNEDSDSYIRSEDDWVPIRGSIEAITKLNNAGYRVAIVSNQSGLARGLFDHGALAKIHGKLHRLLARSGGRIEMIAFCPHGPDDGCYCRKPNTGLLKEVSDRLGVEPRGIPYIGDSIGDVEAAKRIGMEPWLVRTGKGQWTLASRRDCMTGVRVVNDLLTVANELAQNGRGT